MKDEQKQNFKEAKKTTLVVLKRVMSDIKASDNESELVSNMLASIVTMVCMAKSFTSDEFVNKALSAGYEFVNKALSAEFGLRETTDFLDEHCGK